MKSKQRILTLMVIGLIIIIFAIPIWFTVGKPEVCYDQFCYEVEIADTLGTRTQGLMNREKLGQDKGMLFIFEEVGIHPFWMKDTLIPLDIIWINSNKEVVFISRDTQPCQTDPCPLVEPSATALYVLEVNAGTADKIGLHVGSKVNSNFF